MHESSIIPGAQATSLSTKNRKGEGLALKDGCISGNLGKVVGGNEQGYDISLYAHMKFLKK